MSEQDTKITIYKVDGEILSSHMYCPSINDENFPGEAINIIKETINGYFGMMELTNNTIVFFDEEGLCKGLKVNYIFKKKYEIELVGDVVVFDQ